ncbi:MAG TPA: M20/M25/M40 family metallo-hydrolase, partial [Chloroflexaceae bacterium]|nr:M20/M25/M40 family metallo-hydrolase [Chloroflexaceae bacterium]
RAQRASGLWTYTDDGDRWDHSNTQFALLGLHAASQADAPVPALIRRHGEALLGRPVEVAGVPYWTDAASLAEAGIPAVLFGPSGAGAHALEEWVDLESVRQCVAIYARVIAAYCG